MSPPPDMWPGSTAPVRVTVASHRRSGTHLLLEYITRELGVGAIKTHDWPVPHQVDLPLVYIVRDPIETLWSTYRWLVGGKSMNQLIEARLKGLTFAQFLRGDGGPRAGFSAMLGTSYDRLLDARGLLYQPIRFWADHVNEYLQAASSPLIVIYEDLLADPLLQLQRVAAHIGLDPPTAIQPITLSERVGHAPSPVDAPHASQFWEAESLELLQQEAGPVLARLGRPLHAPAEPARRAHTGSIRYIARDDNSGIGVASHRCIEAMLSVGLDVVWEPETHDGRRPPGPNTRQMLLDRYRPKDPCTDTIVHVGPEHWGRARRHFPHSRFIGHLAWEIDRMPNAFHGSTHTVDELWVPTAWNRRTFLDSGYSRPVHVVPHVIDTTPAEPHGLAIPDDVTVFTTVAMWHPRKRPDLAVEAFARAFTKADPVLLVVKTSEATDAMPATSDLQRLTWWRLLEVLRKYPNAPEVLLVTDPMSDGQIRGLLERTDCYVSLAASEGWGLGQFDAAVLGKPVVTTGFGGHLEYLGADHPGLVPFTWTPIGPTERSPHLEPNMLWAAPDVDAAAVMLRRVFEGDSPLLRTAPALAERLQRDYAPTAVGERILSVLEQGR